MSEQDTSAPMPEDLDELMAEVAGNYVTLETQEGQEDAAPPLSEEEQFREQAARELNQMQVLAEERKKYILKLAAKLGIEEDLLVEWKRRHGNLYTFAPNEDDLYMWRPVLKSEWDHMQRTFANQDNAEEKIRETLIKRCVLYPKITNVMLTKSRAGLLQVLSDIIMEGSYFFSIDRALNMVTEL